MKAKENEITMKIQVVEFVSLTLRETNF